MPGDPKKPTAAARKAAAKAKQGTRDQVLAEKSPTPRKRDTNKSNLLGRKREAVIKEGKKQRTDRQTYRSEKESTLTKTKRISAARADRLKKRFDKNVAKKDRVENAASRGFDTTTPTKKGSVRRAKSADVRKEGDEATLTRSRTKKVVKSISRDKAMKLKRKLKKAKEGMKYRAGGKNPVTPPKPGDPGYDERDFRATDEYKKKLKKRAKKTRKAAIAKTAIGKKFKGAAARHAHRRVLDFKGKKYEYKPRKYKPKSDTTYAKGGKFPDLTGDGKVTKADILKGRGVIAKDGTRIAKRAAKADAKAKKIYENGGKVEKLATKSVKKVRNVPRNIEEYRAQRDAKKLKPSHERAMDRYQGQIDKANKGVRAKAKVKKARKKIAKELKPLGMRFNYEPGRTKGAQRRFDRFSKRVDRRTARRSAADGMKYAKHGMKHPSEDKYKNSDGRTLSKSAARESAIKSIRKTAAKKAAKAHKQGDKKGKKIVGYRKAPGSVRNLSQKKVPVYKKEQKRTERGEKKVRKYIDKQARKYAPKGATGRQVSGRPPRVRTAGDAIKYNTAEKKRRDRCAKRGGRDCRRKQRASGGSAAFK